jgi:hypothetical protein
VKLTVPIVDGFNNALTFATTFALMVTRVAPFAGTVEVTTGVVDVALLVMVQMVVAPATTTMAAGVPLVQAAPV